MSSSSPGITPKTTPGTAALDAATRVARRRAAVMVLVVALVLAVGVLAWSVVTRHLTDGDVGVGELHRADALFETAHEYRVEVPTGTVTLEMTAAHTDVDAGRLRSDEDDLHAGGSTELVGFDWRTTSADPWGLAEGRTGRITVTAVADGRRIELGDSRVQLGSDSAAVWTAVPRGSQIDLEVDFDGVTQTVDTRTGDVDPGQAADLYRTQAWYSGEQFTGGTDCSGYPPERDGWEQAPVQCTVGPLRATPWLPGHGWAPAGSTWLVAAIDADAGYFDRAGAARDQPYRPVRARVDVTLDGRSAQFRDVAALVSTGFASYSGSLVWQVSGPPHRLVVDRRFRVRQAVQDGGSMAVVRVRTHSSLHRAD